MADPKFPKPVAEVLAILIHIFRQQGKGDIAEVLERADARFAVINYDNWNGGTYTWALRLEVPVSLFAAIEQHTAEFEKAISAKLSYVHRLYPNDSLDEVTITPVIAAQAGIGKKPETLEDDIKRLWPTGRFRLFVSHVSQHKEAMSALREELALRGVEAFVAHEVIEPTLEWQQEIELALRSMQALAALITDDFHASSWTDQEVGWALGQGTHVLPIRVGPNPYGFTAKVQAIPGKLEWPSVLAIAVVSALLRNKQTHGVMRRSLVASFRDANSHVMAQALRKIIVKVTTFTDEEKAILRNACTENKNIADAYYVPDAIYKAFGKPTVVAESLDEEVPF
jgi:hypothetical protein